MNNRIILMCLTVGGLLALANGCGKTENPPPPTAQADKATSAAKPEPAGAAEKPVAQTTNAVVATADAAKTNLDTGVKAADNAVPSVKATAQVVAATNPPSEKPQGLVSSAQ